MKLSAILIAAVSASPVAHDKDSSVAKSGKPMSGKPDMKPMSGHHDYKDQDGHDMDHDMEEEWKEFQDLMRHGKADNNIMNVNFAPINTNQQNWVNINTEVETDVNVNTGGKKHGKDGKEMEDWEEEFDEGYGKDKFDMEMMKEKMMKMVKVSFTIDGFWLIPILIVLYFKTSNLELISASDFFSQKSDR